MATSSVSRRKSQASQSAAPPVAQDLETLVNGLAPDSGEPPRSRRAAARPPAPPAASQRTHMIDGIPDVWDELSTWTADDWQYRIAYLWRTGPLVDLTTKGGATSIKKITRKFDLETIMQEEGSGSYRIDVCQIDPSGKGQKRILQHYFTIVNMDYPPRVPYGAWIDAPENQMWRWAEPALKKMAEQGEETMLPAAAYIPDPDKMFNTVLNGVQTLTQGKGDAGATTAAVMKLVGDNQTAMMKLLDPATQLSTLSQLMNQLRPAEKGNDLVVEILRDELRSTRQELRDMRTAATTEPKRSFLQELKDAMPVLTDLATSLGFKRAGSTPAGDAWAEVAKVAIEQVGEAVPTIAEAIKYRSAAPPPAWIGVPPAGQTQQSTPAGQAAAPPGAPPENMTDAQLQHTYGPLLNQVAPILVDNFSRNLTGYDFRDWFLEVQGRANWNALRAVGAERLTKLIHTHPILRLRLSPQEKLYAFLVETFTEQGEEPPGVVQPDPNEAPEPPLPATPAAAGFTEGAN